MMAMTELETLIGSDVFGPLEPKTQRRHGILEKYYPADFRTFPIRDNSGVIIPKRFETAQTLVDYAARIRTHRKEGTGIFLYGMNGVGKTHLAVSVQKAAIRQGFRTQFANLAGIINLYAGAWYDSGKADLYDKRVKNSDFLVVDDVGKGFQSERSELAPSVFDELIRYRTNRLLPTIFTTNASLTMLSQTYGVSVASLIEGNTIKLYFEDQSSFPDWRKIQEARRIREQYGGV